MDYRELENRMARNQEMIKERANRQLVKEALKANPKTRKPLFVSLRASLSSVFTRRGNSVESQPQPRQHLKPTTKPTYLA